ncbi:MAG: glycosyltransferase family 4 protein [Anaerolineaceae bacterium]
MADLAYYFSMFPALTTSFIQVQVRATERLGLGSVLISNRRPEAGSYHPHDEDLLQRTLYLTTLGPWRYLAANLRAVLRYRMRYFSALRLAFELRDAFPWQRLKNIGHLAGAAVLAEHLTALGIRHVHIHFAYGAAEVAMFLEALSGIPYSLSIHGSDVLLENTIIEEKLRRARFIVSNCDYHIRNLRQRYSSLDGRKFYVVRGGLDLHSGHWSKFVPVKSDLPLRILHVGRLEPVKAQDVLIRACSLLRDQGRDFRCRIVGDGPLKNRLQELIDKFHLRNHVELLGAKFESEVKELYEWSQVLVLSSRSEGTPMVVIEAMAKGRPVVVPNITALPEMVTHGQTGYLFSPGDPEDLANKLAALIDQPESMTHMGLTARRLAEERYNLDENAGKLTEIFFRELPWASRKTLEHSS